MAEAPTATLGALPELAAQRHGSTAFLADMAWDAYGRPVHNIVDFADAVFDYADRFWAAGIRPGDVVAVIQRNHIEVQALACALNRIGALPVLLSARMEPAELLQCVAKLDRPDVALDGFGLSRFAGHADALRHLTKRLLYIGREDADAGGLTPTGERAAHQVHPRGPDEWAVITHTSGTTGVPKLAAHSTRSLFGMVEVQIAASRKFGEVGLSAKHLSFVHVRTVSIVLAFMEVAMPLLAITDTDPERVRGLMLEHRPESLETHPNVFIQWEPVATHPSRPFSTVGRYVSTFDAMHPRTIRTLLAASDHPRVHYLQGYGQTETGAVCVRVVTRAEVDAYRPRNVGLPVPNAAVRIVDPNGATVPNGQQGAIETMSPGQFRGYLGESGPQPTGSWWAMGDIGRLRPDGSLDILDRIVDHAEGTESFLELEDDLLDRFPELVELVLLRPADEQDLVAVACPRSDEHFDVERFTAAAAELGMERLTVHVRKWEDLPLTGSYKVRRGALRAQLATERVVP